MKVPVVITATLSLSMLMACDENKPKLQNTDLLSTDIVNNPRSASGTDTAAFNSLPILTFQDTLFDFGTIDEGAVVVRDFPFTNTGKTPLIISTATGSCGCTIANYPGEPVAPGKSATVTIRFNSSGKPGHQEKSVTIRTNTARGLHNLFLKGEVNEKK